MVKLLSNKPTNPLLACKGDVASSGAALVAGIVVATDAGLASNLTGGLPGADEELEVEKRRSAPQTSRKDAAIPKRRVLNLTDWDEPYLVVWVVTFLLPNYRFYKRRELSYGHRLR